MYVYVCVHTCAHTFPILSLLAFAFQQLTKYEEEELKDHIRVIPVVQVFTFTSLFN